MFDIDLVYLWCDGNDSSFRKRKYDAIKKLGKYSLNNEEAGEERFYDNDELKYSIRSVEKYANWIHHIYIVTDRQIPKWLNLQNDRVTIIDHSQILPKGMIPCFNSTVIERYIYKIPNLSEHFIYGNDDTFFGKEVLPEYFFSKDGAPIIRVRRFCDYPESLNKNNINSIYKNMRLWGKSVIRSWKMLMNNWNLDEVYPYELVHTFDPYLKSEYEYTFLKYKDLLDNSVSQFRDETDVNRILFSMHSILDKRGKFKEISPISRIQKIESLFYRKEIEDLYVDKKVKSLILLPFLIPLLFCINDKDNVSRLDNIFERIILKMKYPEKSSFEM